MSPVGFLSSITHRLFIVCRWSAGQVPRCLPHRELRTLTRKSLGPSASYTTLNACNANGGNKATLTWVPWDFLKKQDVAPWAEMPMWIPNEGEYAGFGTTSNARAVKAGLKFRPIGETAKDTLAWLQTLPEDQRAKARSSGIKRDKEDKLLAEWKQKKG